MKTTAKNYNTMLIIFIMLQLFIIFLLSIDIKLRQIEAQKPVETVDSQDADSLPKCLVFERAPFSEESAPADPLPKCIVFERAPVYESELDLLKMDLHEEEESEPVAASEAPKTEQEVIDSYIDEICSKYTNVPASIVRGVVWYESRYNPNAHNSKSDCVGLMQLSKKWNQARADKLGVTDWFDPYGNLLVGVDLLSENVTKLGDISYALMSYHGGPNYAKKLWKQGKVDSYTKKILAYANKLEGVT